VRVKNRIFKRSRNLKASLLLLFAVLALILAACGDAATSTPVPQPTTAAASATTAASGNANSGAANTGNNANPGQGNAAGSPGAPGANGNGGGRGNFTPPVNGTIESYDASAKTLTVKDANGNSDKFDVTNARINKTVTITQADLTKLLTGNGIVQVVGDKAADGSYNATRLIVQDPAMAAAFGGNPNGGPNQGQGQPGQAQGQAGQTQPAQGQPGQGQGRGQGRGQGQGQGAPNGTPGAGGQGRFGGGVAGANGVILRSATLSGNQLTGTDFSGAAVTVNLSSSTAMVERTNGSLTDLTSGQKVTVNTRPAQQQGNGVEQAALITID
jgi:hypothetical protein